MKGFGKLCKSREGLRQRGRRTSHDDREGIPPHRDAVFFDAYCKFYFSSGRGLLTQGQALAEEEDILFAWGKGKSARAANTAGRMQQRVIPLDKGTHIGEKG